MFVLLASLLTLVTAQNQDCVYRVGFSPIELNLESLKGQRYKYQSGDNSEWIYSPCQNLFPCEHNGLTVQSMVDHSPIGINECFPWAVYNSSIQPFYDFTIATWIFNYSNGEPCPNPTQINRTTIILWTCEPEDATPRFADAFGYNECNVMIEMKWAGACAPPPPPNEMCEFRTGLWGPRLNLSTVRGSIFSITQQDRNGNPYTYEFSPCANSITCYDSVNGNSKQVMSDIRDSGKQCAKYLAVWSGDAQPFYDRTIFGQDYWDFFWMNGQECGLGGPLEILNARYYCNPKVVGTLNITKAFENGPCAFRIEIDTFFACRNASIPEKTQANSIKRLAQYMFNA